VNNSIITRDILGLRIAVLDKQSAVNFIEQQILNKNPLRLAFVNANLANMSLKDKNLQDCMQSFLLLNDGSGVSIASRLLYNADFPDNLNGTDFIEFFLNNCKIPLRVYLLGSSPRVSKLATDIVKERWPQHQVTGAQHGYFLESETDQVLSNIKEAKPNLILVAMGNGLQEKWVNKLAPDFAISSWGVGAFFDFLSNEVPRAPLWMRQTGVEWIFRLCCEPRRMAKRYLIGNFVFIYNVILQLRLKV
jgi:alpha-1,3-mannosyltransferase